MFRIIQPVAYFAAIWIAVLLLFSLHLSNLLEQDVKEGVNFIVIALASFSFGYIILFLFRSKITLSEFQGFILDNRIEKRFTKFFLFWIICSIVEIIYSGGMPAIWLLTGSSKTYFDFGIPSIHGFLNALQLALGIIAFFIYKKTGKKKFLYFTIFFIVWDISIITRQVLMVMSIEMFVIYMMMSANKLQIIKNVVFFAVIGIIGFGILGDFRSGAEAFYLLAQPSDNWPTWLPSGFLWVYIYLTTPINNLLYNFTTGHLQNILFPNTLSLLLPTVIRKLVFDASTFTVSGDLVTEAFNVSSAFASPFKDMGYPGIIIFGIFIGMFCNLTWWVKGINRVFFRAITVQTILLSIFFNHFFYLPVAFQFIWILLFFKGYKYESEV